MYKFFFVSDGFESDCTDVISYGNGFEFTPLWGDDTSLVWDRDGQIYRDTLDSIKIQCDDYDCIDALDMNTEVDMYVEKNISGSYTQIYRGRFTRQDCAFDEDGKFVTIKTHPVDNNEKLYANFAVEYNVLRISRVYEVHRSGGVEVYQYFIKVRDVIRYLLDHMNSGLNYMSIFFDNDNVAYAYNYVLGAASGTNPLNDIMISQKSNIIEESSSSGHPGSFSAATIGNLSLKDLLESLKEIYDIRWDVTTFGGIDYLRVEHVSYYESTAGALDLTTTKNTFTDKYYSYDTNKYEYLDIPDREEFKYQEKGTAYCQDYFYDVGLIGDDVFLTRKRNIITHSPKLTADISGIHDNPDKFSSEGFVIIQPYYSGGTWYVDIRNQYLDWDSLTSRYWKHNRPYKYAIYGEINEDPDNWDVRTMESTMKAKKQTVSIHGCDTIFGGGFDPAEYVKTGLGNGDISTMSYNLSSEMLEIELLHEIEDNEYPAMPFYFEDETIELFTYMEKTPIWDDKLQVNTIIKSLKDDGLWIKLDFFFCFALSYDDNSETLINWKHPGDTKASLVNSPTFTSYEGYTTNGTSSYINLYQKLVTGRYATQDSSCIFFYARTAVNTPSSPYIDMGAGNGTDYNEIGHANPPTTYVALNGPGSSNTDTDNAGLKCLVRDSSTQLRYYENGSAKAWSPKANTSNGTVSHYIFVGARSDSGTPSNYSGKQYSFAGGGKELTATDVSNLTDIIENYMDYYGKGVIS